jgi:putative oxidoreductase
MFQRIVNTANDFTLTILRLIFGVVFFAHGAQRMLGWFGGRGFGGTLAFYSQMGIPTRVAALAVVLEFLCGLGLLIGFLGRIAAFGILCKMAITVVAVNGQYGFFMNWSGNQKGEGFEYHLLAIALGLKAASSRKRTMFFTAESLIQQLIAADVSRQLPLFLDMLSRLDLIIIDELGYLEITAQAASQKRHVGDGNRGVDHQRQRAIVMAEPERDAAVGVEAIASIDRHAIAVTQLVNGWTPKPNCGRSGFRNQISLRIDRNSCRSANPEVDAADIRKRRGGEIEFKAIDT